MVNNSVLMASEKREICLKYADTSRVFSAEGVAKFASIYRYIEARKSTKVTELNILRALDFKYPDICAMWVGLPKRLSFRLKCKIMLGEQPSVGHCRGCGKSTKALHNAWSLHCGTACAGANPETKSCRIATNMRRYGVPHAAKSETVKEASRNTCRDRYGADTPFGSVEVQAKIRKTMRKRYGVDNPSQNINIQCKRLESLHATKEYMLGDRKVLVQGYEGLALDYIRADGLHATRIKVSADGTIPTIEYRNTGTGRTSRYFPDIYVPEGNLLVEVKSTYTLFQSREVFNNVVEKARACKALGFNFQLMLVKNGPKGISVPIVPNWWTGYDPGIYTELKRVLGGQQ